MFRRLILCIMFVNVVMIGSVRVVSAQEAGTVQEPDKFGYIIDEALDQIEQGLDPASPDNAGLNIEMDIPAGSGSPDEVVEIPQIEFETAAPSGPLISEEAAEIPESAPEVDTPMASEGLREADESQAHEHQTVLETKTIPLMHAEAASLIETLTGMKSPAGEVSYNEEDGTLILKDTAEPLKAMENYIKEVDIPLATEVFQLEYAESEDVILDVQEILTENIGQIHSDDERDSIVITDTPAKIAEIKKLIAALDRLDKEVHIKSRVLQIILNDEHMEGVDWEAIVSDYQELTFSGFNEKAGGRLSLGTISREDYEILLEALDTVGVVRTVSEGNMTADNGAKKTVDILLADLKNLGGDDAASDISLAQDDPSSLTGQLVEKKIQFSITPAIEKDGSLAVAVEPQLLKGIPEGQKTGSGEMTVEVKDGATIIIGSLFKDTMVASPWKIPLLGDLPLLGFVFRSEGEELRKTEVITFLTVNTVGKKENAEK